MTPISPLRSSEMTALRNGTISKAEVADLAKLVKKADPNEVRNLLSFDAFEPGAREALLASLKKQGISIAAPPPSKFAGMKLGTSATSEEVRVKREIGTTGGYAERFQAVAVARLSQAEPVAVMKGADGKFHVLETTASLEGGKPADASMEVTGLASNTRIVALQKQIAGLNTRIKELDTQISSSKTDAEDKPGLKAQRDDLISARADTRKTIAPLLFGVPPGDVHFNRSSTNREEKVVNVNADLAKPGSPRGLHGPVKQTGEGFKLDAPSAFELSLRELDNPQGAEGVLFHEVTHLKDYELTQKFVKQYETETGKPFISNLQGKNPFDAWLAKQATAGKLTKGDAETVIGIANNGGNQTEARAHVGAAIAAMQAGAPEIAIDQISTYAGSLKGNRGLVPGSELEKELSANLKDLYKTLPRDQQEQLKAAVAAAKKANPSSWISSLVLK